MTDPVSLEILDDMGASLEAAKARCMAAVPYSAPHMADAVTMLDEDIRALRRLYRAESEVA